MSRWRFDQRLDELVERHPFGSAVPVAVIGFVGFLGVTEAIAKALGLAVCWFAAFSIVFVVKGRQRP